MKKYKQNSFPFIFMILLLTGFVTVHAQEKNDAWYLSQAPFSMKQLKEPQFADKTFSITDYGAVSDGQTLNTEAFQKAISACANGGGGKVIVPSGLWLTGPIGLQSNVNLVVERGALVLFTADHSQYPVIKPKGSSAFTVLSPIYGYNLKNIAVTGEGVLDGAGDSWRPVKKIKTTAAQWKTLTATGVVSPQGDIWWPTREAMEGEMYLKKLKDRKTELTAENYLPARDYLRPYMVYFSDCENILITGVTFRNSPKFVFCPNNCINLSMKYVNIFNEWYAQNGDGIDISACKNVLIYKCTVSAGDDGICMKSSGKTNGPDDPRLENIIVAACVVYRAHGGFVIGSNTDGGMRNIFVTDCNFIGSDIGIRVKSNAGRGGLVHHVYIRNIYMDQIAHEAISFDTYYEDVPAGKEKVVTTIKDKIPVFEDFTISNIYCHDAETAISITGLPEMPVRKINFENVIISSKKGYEAKDSENISQKNVKIIIQKT